jgi:hypothetical protein
MGLFDRVKEGLDQGLDGSRTLLVSAKEKSRILEEISVLKIDIKRLDIRINSLIRDLGLSVYSAFIEEGKQSLSAKSPAIKSILQELQDLQELRKVKEDKIRQYR